MLRFTIYIISLACFIGCASSKKYKEIKRVDRFIKEVSSPWCPAGLTNSCLLEMFADIDSRPYDTKALLQKYSLDADFLQFTTSQRGCRYYTGLLEVPSLRAGPLFYDYLNEIKETTSDTLFVEFSKIMQDWGAYSPSMHRFYRDDLSRVDLSDDRINSLYVASFVINNFIMTRPNPCPNE